LIWYSVNAQPNNKNLILDYLREALAFFAPENGRKFLAFDLWIHNEIP